jgi:hypothetical protein
LHQGLPAEGLLRAEWLPPLNWLWGRSALKRGLRAECLQLRGGQSAYKRDLWAECLQLRAECSGVARDPEG